MAQAFLIECRPIKQIFCLRVFRWMVLLFMLYIKQDWTLFCPWKEKQVKRNCSYFYFSKETIWGLYEGEQDGLHLSAASYQSHERAE